MIKNFISRIQNSDEATKKFWLFVSSGVTMAIVVVFWLAYMNMTVAQVEQPSAALPQRTTNDQRLTTNDEPGFFTIFFAGLKTIYDQIQNKIVSATNNISIENPRRNFQLDRYEE